MNGFFGCLREVLHILFARVQSRQNNARNQFTKGFLLGFPTGRDSATFRDNGTEVPSLSRDKGTTGQAQNLATGRDRMGF